MYADRPWLKRAESAARLHSKHVIQSSIARETHKLRHAAVLPGAATHGSRRSLKGSQVSVHWSAISSGPELLIWRGARGLWAVRQMRGAFSGLGASPRHTEHGRRERQQGYERVDEQHIAKVVLVARNVGNAEGESDGYICGACSSRVRSRSHRRLL
jgi:hypothetical protein